MVLGLGFRVWGVGWGSEGVAIIIHFSEAPQLQLQEERVTLPHRTTCVQSRGLQHFPL